MVSPRSGTPAWSPAIRFVAIAIAGRETRGSSSEPRCCRPTLSSAAPGEPSGLGRRRHGPPRLHPRDRALARALISDVYRHVLRPSGAQHRGIRPHPHRRAARRHRRLRRRATGPRTPPAGRRAGAPGAGSGLGTGTRDCCGLPASSPTEPCCGWPRRRRSRRTSRRKVRTAAAAAGRPAPRIVAGLPVAVHDDEARPVPRLPLTPRRTRGCRTTNASSSSAMLRRPPTLRSSATRRLCARSSSHCSTRAPRTSGPRCSPSATTGRRRGGERWSCSGPRGLGTRPRLRDSSYRRTRFWMASPRRGRRRDIEEEIMLLDCVERLMLETGYASVTYRAVAAKAGVTSGLVQYYFPTLDDLFVAAIRRRSEQNLERLAEALRTHADQPCACCGSTAGTSRPRRSRPSSWPSATTASRSGPRSAEFTERLVASNSTRSKRRWVRSDLAIARCRRAAAVRPDRDPKADPTRGGRRDLEHPCRSRAAFEQYLDSTEERAAEAQRTTSAWHRKRRVVERQLMTAGIESQPRTVVVGARRAPSMSISHSGNRFSTSSRAMRPSSRASAAPRQ